MDHNNQDKAYASFVDARLTQIEKYILADKINGQKYKIFWKELEQQKKRIDINCQKMKLMQMGVNNHFEQFDRLTRKVQKIIVNVQNFKKMETKVYDLLQKMQQTYTKTIKKIDLQNCQQKIISSIRSQIKGIEGRMKIFQEQIYYVQEYFLTIKPNKQSPPISMSSIMLPTQLLVTKKQLRQNIELMEQVYSKKIKKIEKKIKNFKNNKIHKTVAEIGQKFDQYDLSKNRRSQNSLSKSRSVVERKYNNNNESGNKNNTEISFKKLDQKKNQDKMYQFRNKRVSFSLAKKKKRMQDSRSPYSLQLKINGRSRALD